MPMGASKEVRVKRAAQEAKNLKGTKVLPDPQGNPFVISAFNAANIFLKKQRKAQLLKPPVSGSRKKSK